MEEVPGLGDEAGRSVSLRELSPQCVEMGVHVAGREDDIVQTSNSVQSASQSFS
jgi:hypothetical protein